MKKNKETIFETFEKALKRKFAIGAFNFYNLESLQAILEAGEEMGVPIICSVSEGALQYMGFETTAMLFETLSQNKKHPAFLHLDHGKSFEICKKAIDIGFDSVMIDGSSLPFDENVKLTQKVVKYAEKQGVFVEGELGVLSGVEDNNNVANEKAKYTNPNEAKLFVEKTGVNSLAVAIGTSHGAYKFKGEPKLRFDILAQIEAQLGKFPIVLHGASIIEPMVIKQINKRGGKLKNAKGVNPSDLKYICNNHNVCKINVDTDLRLALIASLRKTMKSCPSEINPRIFFTEAKEEVKDAVVQRLQLFKK